MDQLDQTLRDRFSLEGQRGIVTGGSSGLGLSICETLALAGAEVFAFSRTGAATSEIDAGTAERIHHIKADVTNASAIEAAVQEIGPGGLDFLVNNAGITEKKPATDFSKEAFRKIQEVNVDALFHLSRLAYPYLRAAKRAGRVVNISSMAAHLGFTGVVPYCASKSAVTGITRGLAVEWAKDNVLVNSVAPGWFPSEMNRQVVDPEREKVILNRMPLHRYGEPAELANVILFLLSPAASYITGQDFAVDGGALAFGY